MSLKSAIFGATLALGAQIAPGISNAAVVDPFGGESSEIRIELTRQQVQELCNSNPDFVRAHSGDKNVCFVPEKNKKKQPSDVKKSSKKPSEPCSCESTEQTKSVTKTANSSQSTEASRDEKNNQNSPGNNVSAEKQPDPLPKKDDITDTVASISADVPRGSEKLFVAPYQESKIVRKDSAGKMVVQKARQIAEDTITVVAENPGKVTGGAAAIALAAFGAAFTRRERKISERDAALNSQTLSLVLGKTGKKNDLDRAEPFIPPVVPPAPSVDSGRLSPHEEATMLGEQEWNRIVSGNASVRVVPLDQWVVASEELPVASPVIEDFVLEPSVLEAPVESVTIKEMIAPIETMLVWQLAPESAIISEIPPISNAVLSKEEKIAAAKAYVRGKRLDQVSRSEVNTPPKGSILRPKQDLPKSQEKPWQQGIPDFLKKSDLES